METSVRDLGWGFLSCSPLSICWAGSLQVQSKWELGPNAVESGAIFCNSPFQTTLGPKFLLCFLWLWLTALEIHSQRPLILCAPGVEVWEHDKVGGGGPGAQEHCPDSQTRSSHGLASGRVRELTLALPLTSCVVLNNSLSSRAK